MFVDNIAVCNSKESNFIKAFSKQYITEETTLQTAIPATGSNPNCIFAISHQYPLGGEYVLIDFKFVLKLKNIIKYVWYLSKLSHFNINRSFKYKHKVCVIGGAIGLVFV